MNLRPYVTLAFVGAVVGGSALTIANVNISDANQQRYMKWEVHDRDRPQPPVVDPGYAGTQQQAGQAPSDAIVLFDGTNTNAFEKNNGEPAGWVINDKGELVITNGSGSIQTKQAFGDIQLHLEWFVPNSMAENTGQIRGNSGVYLMKQYEIQVLDNNKNATYPDGMAGGIYGQFPPLVNAGRGIGQWQTYDIIFRRPHFNEDGSLKQPATVTVLHNGVVTQDNQELMGPTRHMRRTQYQAHADKLPLYLQNHGEIVHYRNIWVRELAPRENPAPYEN